MCRRKEIEFGITEAFEKEESLLEEKEREEVGNRLNALGDMAKADRVRGLYRLAGAKFPEGYDRRMSTLYLYKLSKGLRAVLGYDDDPVFDKKIITLFRLVSKDESGAAFNDTARILYGCA